MKLKHEIIVVKLKLTGSLSSQKGFSYYQPFSNETQNTIDKKVASKLNALDTIQLSSTMESADVP